MHNKRPVLLNDRSLSQPLDLYSPAICMDSFILLGNCISKQKRVLEIKAGGETYKHASPEIEQRDQQENSTKYNSIYSSQIFSPPCALITLTYIDCNRDKLMHMQ
jgi:hypothetical protein